MTADTLAALLGACFLVAGFLVILQLLRLVERARTVGQHAHAALVVLADIGLDDAAKEAAMQKQALMLFRGFAILTLGGAIALLAPAFAVWGADHLGWVSFDDVWRVMLDWRFIVAASVLSVFVMRLVLPKKNVHAANFENRYSTADRLVHEVAFATRPLQTTVAAVEDKVFARRLSSRSTRPVFITALPRAGTTLMLELCCELPEFASHSYRHMPFVLTPMLWQKLSARFRARDEARERAHGDGMLVSVESPEAFEEIIWMSFWRGHYRADSIAPWGTRPSPAFDAFFARHRDKIVALDSRRDAQPSRYISKNNLNIARVQRLVEHIPDCRVLIPFRDPWQHAWSLLTQHRHFTRMHREDEFARIYMAGIGHFDFGANLKPVDFDGWLAHAQCRDAGSYAFWLAYWCAAYRHLLARQCERIRFSDFDALCAVPERGLQRIAEYLEVADAARLVAQAGRLRAPRSAEVPRDEIDATLRTEVDALYAQLRQAAL